MRDFKVGDKIKWKNTIPKIGFRGQFGIIKRVLDMGEMNEKYDTEVLSGEYTGKDFYGTGEFYELVLEHNRNGANST